MPDDANRCRACGRPDRFGCSSTRDMEDSTNDPVCKAALMAFGGGEYTVNRREAGDWLRLMESALSLHPGTRELVASPIEAEPGTERSARLSALAAAGFLVEEPREGAPPCWTLGPRGMDAVLERGNLWLPR